MAIQEQQEKPKESWQSLLTVIKIALLAPRLPRTQPLRGLRVLAMTPNGLYFPLKLAYFSLISFPPANHGQSHYLTNLMGNR